jgi:hypothetical protein
MNALTVECQLHVRRQRKGQVELAEGPAPAPLPNGRIPRITRLLALAHRFERLVAEGTIADYADLARRGRVTRARLSQIMNLTLLAPDIQEAILFLPRTTQRRDPVQLRHLQPIALTPAWPTQRRLWRKLVAEKS